jgi:large subunit ribosomal protein L28
MARICQITGKKNQFGRLVSHANNKTNRRFRPNLQNVSFLSDLLGISVKARLSTHAIRSVEKKGGLDCYLLNTGSDFLSSRFKRLKKVIEHKANSNA